MPATSAASSSSSSSRAPRRRNSTRDRERAELLALRQLARELEQHAELLRRSNQQQPLASHSRAGVALAWRRLADRQQRARRDAAQVQRQLTDRVQSNADWIERLWGLLLERRRSDAAAFNARAAAALQSKWEQSVMFERLKLDVQAAARRSTDVFASHGIRALGDHGDLVEEDHWSHVPNSDEGSTLVCARWVPFDPHTTATTVWGALSSLQSCSATTAGTALVEAAQAWRVVEQAHDFCTLKFRERLTLPSRGESTLLTYHALVQQVATHDVNAPKVFIWDAVSLSADGAAEHSELMWLAVEQAPSSRLVSRVAIVTQSRVKTNPQSDGAEWRAAIMPLVEACVGVVLTILDNKLLDERIVRSPTASASELPDLQVTV